MASRSAGATGPSSTSCGSSSPRPSTSSRAHNVINPLRSEEEAFRFVIGALAYVGAIAAAAVIDKWAGLFVFIVLTAGILVLWVRARRDEAPIRTAPRPSAADERRILVIAN